MRRRLQFKRSNIAAGGSLQFHPALRLLMVTVATNIARTCRSTRRATATTLCLPRLETSSSPFALPLTSSAPFTIPNVDPGRIVHPASLQAHCSGFGPIGGYCLPSFSTVGSQVQRLSSATEAITVGTCWPHPHQVTFSMDEIVSIPEVDTLVCRV